MAKTAAIEAMATRRDRLVSTAPRPVRSPITSATQPAVMPVQSIYFAHKMPPMIAPRSAPVGARMASREKWFVALIVEQR